MKKINISLLCVLLHLMLLLQSSCTKEEDNNTNINDPIENKESENHRTFAVGTIGNAVDLGLSVKWADHNVGASKPTDFGGYYSFGETEEKISYKPETYKWLDLKGGLTNFTKYNRNDQKETLDLEDDVAHVKWGGSWRLPTFDEIFELHSKCKFDREIINDIPGWKVTGPNNNSIFLPDAGYYTNDYVVSLGQDSRYLSCTPVINYFSRNKGDTNCYVLDGKFMLSNYEVSREGGYSARPVRK